MDESQPGLWFSRKDALTDAPLVLLPWLWLLFLFLWGRDPGSWAVGDGFLFGWSISLFSPCAGGALALFMVVRSFIRRSNLVVNAVAFCSFVACGLLAPALAKA
jgi:hypothetical protein